MKSLSLLSLVLAAALAGCDAGIAGSSGAAPTGGGSPSLSSSPSSSRCSKSGGSAMCPSDAAASAAETPASLTPCPNGQCDAPGECGLEQCQPAECEEMKKKCDGSAKKECAPKSEPKVGN